jgi:hypothetical protein
VDASNDPSAVFHLRTLFSQNSPAVTEDWKATALAVTPQSALYLQVASEHGSSGERTRQRRQTEDTGTSDGDSDSDAYRRANISIALEEGGVLDPLGFLSHHNVDDPVGCKSSERSSSEYGHATYEISTPSLALFKAALRNSELWWYVSATTNISLRAHMSPAVHFTGCLLTHYPLH